MIFIVKLYNIMTKKLIRLTEGDLHRIIKESVERIINEAQLNELAPRTYASYAQKRAAQGQYDKAERGRNAAVDAFNKQYGSDVKDDNGNPFSHIRMDKNDGNGYTIYSDNPIGDGKKYYDTSDKRPNVNFYKRMDASDGMRHRYNVVDQMAKGDGEYIKGQGWQ